MLGLMLGTLASTLLATNPDGYLNSTNGTCVTPLECSTLAGAEPMLFPGQDNELMNFRDDYEFEDKSFLAAEDDAEYEDGGDTPEIGEPKNITYVPMPMPESPREIDLYVQGTAPGQVKTIRNISHKMKSFYERMSRHKISITASSGLKDLRQRGPNRLKLIFRPGAHSHVPIIGNAIGAAHEFGHELGLGHANTRIWATQTKVKQARGSHDPFDVMVSAGGSANLNAAHLHFKGWFNPTEEAYIEDGAEYTLKLLNAGGRDGRDFSSLKALYYETPGLPSRKLWLSYVKVHSKGWHAPEGMPQTAVAIHSNGGSSTFFEGMIGLKPESLVRYGLIVEVSEPTDRTVKVKIKKDPTWVLQE